MKNGDAWSARAHAPSCSTSFRFCSRASRRASTSESLARDGEARFERDAAADVAVDELSGDAVARVIREPAHAHDINRRAAPPAVARRVIHLGADFGLVGFGLIVDIVRA